MLDNLSKLIKEIRAKEPKEFDAQIAIQSYRYYSSFFDALLVSWIKEVKNGNYALVQEMNNIIDTEIELRKAKDEYPKPKEKNSLWMLLNFKGRMKQLDYYVDLIKLSCDSLACNCNLRQKHYLEPKELDMLDICNKVYYLDKQDDYLLYKCRLCSAKWVLAYSTELKIRKNWMKWNPKDFPLQDKFN